MDDYVISSFEESQFNAVKDFVVQDYVQRERCCVTSGLAQEIEDYHDLVNMDLHQMLDQGHSFVALNKSDQSVAGIAISTHTEVEYKAKEHIPQCPKPFQAISMYCDALKDKLEIKLSLANGLYFKMLGVGRAHGGKGLGRRLTEKIVESAQQKGFSYVEGIPTAPETRHLFESLGFETKSEIKFRDFFIDDNGTSGFPHATSQDFGRFTVKTFKTD